VLQVGGARPLNGNPPKKTQTITKVKQQNNRENIGASISITTLAATITMSEDLTVTARGLFALLHHLATSEQ
jgi:hypothetical protein